jgi:hypothetical protein
MRRTSLKLGVIFTLSLFSTATAAWAAEDYKRAQLDTNFNLHFDCALSDGHLQQNAAAMAASLGIPGGAIVAGLAAKMLILSRGSGRCIAVRMSDTHVPLGIKEPWFTHKIYDTDGRLLLTGPTHQCTVPMASICVPNPLLGGDQAGALTACFELRGEETSDHQPRSVVLKLALTSTGIPAGLDADQSVTHTACSARHF